MNATANGTKLFTAMAVAVLLAVAVVPAVDSAYEDYTGDSLIADDSDAISSIVVAGLWVASIVATAIVAYWVGTQANSGNGGAVDTDGENHEQVEDFKLFVDTHLADLNGGLGIDTQTLKWTQMYWNRLAEVEVAEAWSVNGNVEGYINAILESSTFLENIGTHYRSWESVIDTPFEKMENVPALNKANGYDKIAWGIYADDQRYESTSTMSFDAGTYVDVQNGQNTVYLSTTGTGLEGTAQAMDSIYVYKAGYLDATFVDDHGNQYHAKKYLTPGRYSIGDLGIVDGYCTMYDGMWVGPFLPAGVNNASLTGALVTCIDGSTYGYVVPNSSGYTYCDGSITRTVSDFGEYASYQDKNDNEVYTPRSAASLLRSWDNLIGEYETLAQNVVKTVKAQWMLFDTIGSANVTASVTAYVPDLDNLKMTAEQSYAVALLAQIQNAEWYGSNSTQISASDIKISESSLDLKCVGTICDDLGNVVKSDVVFTPLVWLHDARVATGTTTWSQKALAIIWGNAGDTGGEFSVANMSLVYMSAGYTTDIDTITYMGKDVEAMPLEVKQMDLVLSGFDHVYDPTPMPDDSTLATIVIVLLALAGAAILFDGIRRGQLFMLIIGAVLIVAGLIFHNQIADLIDDLMGAKEWFKWI